MIQLHNVSLAYQKDATALNNITLRIDKGEFVFLTGPSGAGKTTLLRLLYGALTPTRGQVLIDGTECFPYDSIPDSSSAALGRGGLSGFQAAVRPGPFSRTWPSPWRCSAGAGPISAKRSCTSSNRWGWNPRST